MPIRICYLLLHNKLLAKLGAPCNNKYLLSHVVSVAQEFRSDFPEWFRYEVSHYVVAKLLARAEVLCRLDWLEALLPGWVTNVTGELGLTLVGGLSSPPCKLTQRAACMSLHGG